MNFTINASIDYRANWPVVTMAVLALVLPGLAQAADGDEDGVDDAVDNCVEVANADQRDTDLDGYGNICDPDFDNNGTVDFQDLGTLKQAFFSSAEEQDLNGDGSVNFVDLGIIKQYFFGRPGPGAPDTDGDGVPLDQDRCPNSLPDTGQVLIDGCTSLDIVADPAAYLDRSAHEAEVIAILSDMPEFGEVLALAQIGFDTMRASVAQVGRAEVCDGMNNYWNGRNTLDGAAVAMRDFIASYEVSLAANPPFSAEDCRLGGPPECEIGADQTQADTLLIAYQDAMTDIDELLQVSEQRGSLFTQACETAGSMDRLGQVLAVDDAGRRVHLVDLESAAEFTIVVADGAVVEADLYTGREIIVTGLSYGQHAGVAGSLVPVGSGTPPVAGLEYNECGVFMIAPFQRFAPIATSGFELHDPDAYFYSNGVLRLEKGMGLAMVHAVGCVDSNADHTVNYTMSLHLTFDNAWTGQLESRLLALNMTPSSHPVLLPEEIEHNSVATLTVTHRRQSCPQPNGQPLGQVCSEHEEYQTEVYELSVYDRGTFCNAIYDRTSFELEWATETEFRSAFVSDKQTLFVEPDPGTEMSIVAEGFADLGSNASTWPSVVNIVEGDRFAVFKHDCVTTPGQLYVEGQCGTNSPSGLRWPRLTGQHNGRTFSYTCSLPRVVRDLRDYCPQAPDAFYKLPFSGGNPDWLMSQANDGEFTHNGDQEFAFDFQADQGTIVRAARGGVVDFVRQDQTGNSYDDPGCSNCMPNRVSILHEDGTVADYVHFRTNGVLVSQGSEVRRGASIGEVGNTGYSTGPHLHFQARFPGSSFTHPVRFESLNNGESGPPSTCWIPETGDDLSSDNN